MTSERTKGPWEAEQSSDSKALGWEVWGNVTGRMHAEVFVAEVETEANAKAIAKLPDLEQALREVCTQYRLSTLSHRGPVPAWIRNAEELLDS